MSWELCQNSRIRQIAHFMIGNIRNQFPCAILHYIGVEHKIQTYFFICLKRKSISYDNEAVIFIFYVSYYCNSRLHAELQKFLGSLSPFLVLIKITFVLFVF